MNIIDGILLFILAISVVYGFYHGFIQSVAGLVALGLSILSGLSVADLAQAITLQESARLVKVPGIGKKTAERLLLELKGKLGAELPSASGSGAQTDTQRDIEQALLALGYSEKEAQAALKGLPADVTVSDGIKQALKALAK